MIRRSVFHSTTWKECVRNTTTGNTKREKEKDIASTNAVSLSRYEHIRNAAQTVPPGMRYLAAAFGTEGGTTKKRCIARTYRGVRRNFNKWRKKRPLF